MKKLPIALALVLAAAAPAAAQPGQGEPSASEVRAARELLEVSRTRENFIEAMELGMEQGGMMELTPAVREALRKFMNEHLAYDDLEPDFIRLYTDVFTEEELRGLAAFYRTPLGRRVVETLPRMSAESQRIVNERLQPLMPQLIEVIMGAMQDTGTTSTP